MDSTQQGNFKSGFVAILGRPNVGKSTLLNALIGSKISIVSTIPQTTRHQVRAVLTLDNAQIVFVDTPGIHSFKKMLVAHLNKIAKSSVEGIELIVYVVDVTRSIGREERAIMEFIARSKKKGIMLLNKMDLGKDFLSQYIEAWKSLLHARHVEEDPFAYYIPISAKTGKNLDKVKESIVELLPYQHPFYDKEDITDFPLTFRVADVIREKLFIILTEELPHSLAVEVKDITHKENVVYIRAIVYINRVSQKKIVIGHKGAIIKRVGIEARQDLETIFARKVYLDVTVKVLKDWQNKARILKELGYWAA